MDDEYELGDDFKDAYKEVMKISKRAHMLNNLKT